MTPQNLFGLASVIMMTSGIPREKLLNEHFSSWSLLCRLSALVYHILSLFMLCLDLTEELLASMLFISHTSFNCTLDFNLVIYRVPESDGETAADRASDDKLELSTF